MKRLLCMMLAVMLALGTGAALADEPKEINTIPFDQLPEVVEGQHHYLLLCVDQWTGKPHNLGNTDGIVLVTLDTRAHRLMLTSIIRDALVKRPDGKAGRITYIAKNYGPEALCRVISEHIGVRIEKYLLFDWRQIEKIVDFLGGVDIEITASESSYLQRYAIPKDSTQPRLRGYLLFDWRQIEKIVDFLGGVDIEITASESSYLQRYAIPKDSTQPRLRGAGTYHFNGHAALIYMRIRKVGGGGDFMRTQRVRTVLSTLADQCREITLEDARLLVDNVLENTTMTNMTTDDMVEAMNYAMELRGCTMEELRLPPDGASSPISYAGMSVQEIDWEACRTAMADYLQNSFLVMDEEE